MPRAPAFGVWSLFAAEGRERQSGTEDLARIQKCHQAVADAIAAHDADAAADAMTKHFEVATRAIKRIGTNEVPEKSSDNS